MNLGLWSPYVQAPEMLSWYALPAELARESALYVPDGTELNPLSNAQFAALNGGARAYADISVARLNLAYHNPTHFTIVEREGMAALYTYEQITGHVIPKVVKQIMSVALYTHDADHCGSTFRAMAPRPELLALPELGTRVSSEWVTALATSRLLKKYGIVLPARLFQIKIHWASTYGGQTEFGRKLGFPVPDPQDLYGCIMRAADVCPSDNFSAWIASSIAVNYGETPASPAPTTWADFLRVQIAFTGYIEHCFNRLDAVAGVDLTHELRWRDRLARIRTGLHQIANGDNRAAEVLIRTEVAKYNVTLS